MIKEEQLIASIVIDNFSEYIEVSKARRIKPYVQGKCRVPKKYQTEQYKWKTKGKLTVLVDDDTGRIVASNSKSVGTPKYRKVNGQDIYNQRINSFGRSALVKKMHDYFTPYLKKLPKFDINQYPLTVELIFKVKDQGKKNIDDDNKWIWTKCVKDTITDLGKWEDDNVYVTNGTSTKTILIPDDEEQKLIINIYGSQ